MKKIFYWIYFYFFKKRKIEKAHYELQRRKSDSLSNKNKKYPVKKVNIIN